MKEKIVFCILSVLGTAMSAQQPSQEKMQQDDYHSVITVSAFSPVRDQRWNVGYVHKINSRWWLGAELGYGQRGITPREFGVGENDKLFEVKPEIYYSLNPDSKLKHLISFEISYLDHQSKGFSGNYYDESGDYYHFLSADYKRTRERMGINYSILLYRKSSWFGFMPKVGLGIAHNNITYRNIEDREPAYEPTDGLPFLPGLNRERNVFQLHVNIDLKFIFKF